MKAQTVQETKDKSKGKGKSKEEEIPKARTKKSRRDVKLMFDDCPLCQLPLSIFDEIRIEEKKKFFQLVQFTTNPDGTGFESYHCGYCKRFFMMIVGLKPMQARVSFSEAGGPQQQQQGAPQQQGTAGPQGSQAPHANSQQGTGGPFG